MNSQQLRTLSPESYDSFFQDQHVVASAPLQLRIVRRAYYLGLNPFIAINRQARAYSGLSVLSGRGVTINEDLMHFNYQESSFEPVQTLKTADVSGLSAEIEKFLYDESGFSEDLGVTVSWLFEMQLTIYQPTLTSGMVALATSLLLLTESINEDDLLGFHDLSYDSLYDNDVTSRIAQLAYRFQAALYPDFLRPNSYAASVIGRNSVFLQLAPASLDSFSDSPMLLDFELSTSRSQSLPLDIACFHGGTVINIYENETLSSALSPNPDVLSPSPLSNFLGNDLPSDSFYFPGDLDNAHQKLHYSLLTQVAEAMTAVTSNYSRENSDRVLNRLQKIEALDELCVPDLRYLNAIKQYFAHDLDTVFSIDNFYPYKEGEYKIIAPFGHLQQHLDSLTEKFIQDYPQSFFYYKSWENTGDIDGCKVEKNTFRTGDAGVLKKYVFPTSSIYTPLPVAEHHSACLDSAFCFDAVEGHVYMNGERIHSTQLKSQSFTCELLYLLVSCGPTIESTSLPQGSYRECVNTLRSKILSPLNKLFEKDGFDMKLTATSAQNDFGYTISIVGEDEFTVLAE